MVYRKARQELLPTRIRTIVDDAGSAAVRTYSKHLDCYWLSIAVFPGVAVASSTFARGAAVSKRTFGLFFLELFMAHELLNGVGGSAFFDGCGLAAADVVAAPAVTGGVVESHRINFPARG